MPSMFTKLVAVEEKCQDPYDEDHSVAVLYDEVETPLSPNESSDCTPRYYEAPQRSQKLFYCPNITLFCISLIVFSVSRFEAFSPADLLNNTLIRETSAYCWYHCMVRPWTAQLTQPSTNSGSSPHSAHNREEERLVQPEGTPIHLSPGSKP